MSAETATPPPAPSKNESSSERYKDISDRITSGLTYATGGVALGTLFAGPVGGAVIAAASGVLGLVIGGHHPSKPKN